MPLAKQFRPFSHSEIHCSYAIYGQNEGPKNSYTLEQIHSNKIYQLSEDTCKNSVKKVSGDGLLTRLKNYSIAVKSADCVPILCFDPQSMTIAALHSGWRGTVSGIFEEFYHKLENPSNLEVYLGPAICGSCFEIRSDAKSLFDLRVQKTGMNQAYFEQCLEVINPNHWKLDLRKFLQLELKHVYKIRAENIHLSEACTFHSISPKSFPSYRRDGHTKNLLWSSIQIQS